MLTPDDPCILVARTSYSISEPYAFYLARNADNDSEAPDMHYSAPPSPSFSLSKCTMARDVAEIRC